MNYKEKFYKYHGLDKCDFVYCVICGAVAIDLHHIIYRSQGGTDTPENLAPMCFKCHSDHHTNNKPTTKEIINARNNNIFNQEIVFKQIKNE
jgi:5-methylcytosine-specific restriction endonuclease McrA